LEALALGYPRGMNASVLWILAVLFVIAGLIGVLQGNVLIGLLLVLIGVLIGPGGVSVFSRRS
jgi:hypothetical protein